MCTVLVRFASSAAHPVQLAFVRDEDRARRADPPGRWWPRQPQVIGGRDARAGGTWLAIEDGPAPAIALLTDQYDPAATLPDPTRSPSRGVLPLLALERGSRFDLEADAPGGVDRFQSFHLVTIRCDDAAWTIERWGWTGAELEHELLRDGDHVIASRSATIGGESERRARLLAELSQVPHGAPPTAWHALLDSRDVAADDMSRIAVHSVASRPGFGTIGASLVRIDSDQRVGFDVNHTPRLSPEAWTTVNLESPVTTT